MSEEHHESRFSSTDAVEIAEYPPVSRQAIVALLLGLVSFAAIFSQVMWILPLGGVIVALTALRSIARSERAMIGRRAALIGLALSLLFGVWAPVHYYVRWEILSRQSREHAKHWFAYIQKGQLYHAHQLRLPREERQKPDVNLPEYYDQNEEVDIDFREFRKMPCVQEIVKAGSALRVRYVRDEGYKYESTFHSKSDVVTQRFVLEFDDQGTPRTLPVTIKMVHVREPNKPEDYWFVRSCEKVKDEGDWSDVETSGFMNLPRRKRKPRCAG